MASTETQWIVTLTYRQASQADVPILAELNRQLIEDERHRKRMSLAELEQRMRAWLQGDYEAIIFEENGVVLVYALYRPDADYIYLRQFFVNRNHRRKGIGRRAINILRAKVWPANARVRVEVLVGNEVAKNFWRSVGFLDYAMTMETK